jgi:hypothetical protein
VAWLVLIAGVILVLGVVFRAFVLANFILPVALVLLIAWRVVISVHQAIYWGGVILALTALIGYHLIQTFLVAEAAPPLPPESMLKSLSYWRAGIQASSDLERSASTLKRELAQMLVAIQSAKAPEAKPFSLYEALERGEIALPDRIYAFLFPGQAQPADRTWQGRLQHWAQAPSRWARHWTGRDQAEYYQAIEETITYMETLMEIKHGDDYFDAQH